MTTYEILLMLDPDLAEERQNEVIQRTRDLVEQGGGTWTSHDAWGRRKLTYEIAKKTDGIYHLFVFDAEPATLDEISRVLKITDGVMRHMATKHIPGSRTSAPREEHFGERPERGDRPDRGDRGDRGPRRDAVPAAEYAGSNTRSDEEE